MISRERYTTLMGDGRFRRCGKCHKTLPITEFRQWKDTRGGVTNMRYESYCKDCRREYMRERSRVSPAYRKHQQESSKKSYSYVKARRQRDPEYDAKVKERNRRRAKRMRDNRKRARLYGS